MGPGLVNLSSVMDPTLVIPSIAEILSVTAEAGQSLQEALASSLREKAMLVVLDDFEQVVDAGAAVELLCRLLRASWSRAAPLETAILRTYTFIPAHKSDRPCAESARKPRKFHEVQWVSKLDWPTAAIPAADVIEIPSALDSPQRTGSAKALSPWSRARSKEGSIWTHPKCAV
jgi:hypothetical protein